MRLDGGIYAGMQVPLFYDSLLAKLVCWGQDRTEALARMRRALDEYTIAGVRTTIPFHQWLLRHPSFIAGDFSTDFIAEEWHPDEAGNLTDKAAQNGAMAGEVAGELAPEEVAALVATLAAEAADRAAAQRRQAGVNSEDDASAGSRWRAAGRRSAVGGW